MPKPAGVQCQKHEYNFHADFNGPLPTSKFFSGGPGGRIPWFWVGIIMCRAVSSVCMNCLNHLGLTLFHQSPPWGYERNRGIWDDTSINTWRFPFFFESWRNCQQGKESSFSRCISVTKGQDELNQLNLKPTRATSNVEIPRCLDQYTCKG